MVAGELEVLFLDIIPFLKSLDLGPMLLVAQIVNVTLEVCRAENSVKIRQNFHKLKLLDQLHGIISVGLKSYEGEEKFLHFVVVKRFHQTLPNAIRGHLTRHFGQKGHVRSL